MDGAGMLSGWNPVDSEKITINMGAVDLGKVDLLVDEGFYGNRTDFIRTAIRNQLEKHEGDMNQTMTRKSMTVGALIYERRDLEKHRAAGEMLVISAVGLVSLASDITPELALATIESISVRGVFRASKEVKAALADRTR
jgi:Arc/MetJ-type ribon-helix-helix transcriptional regulator